MSTTSFLLCRPSEIGNDPEDPYSIFRNTVSLFGFLLSEEYLGHPYSREKEWPPATFHHTLLFAIRCVKGSGVNARKIFLLLHKTAQNCSVCDPRRSFFCLFLLFFEDFLLSPQRLCDSAYHDDGRRVLHRRLNSLELEAFGGDARSFRWSISGLSLEASRSVRDDVGSCGLVTVRSSSFLGNSHSGKEKLVSTFADIRRFRFVFLFR